MSKARGHRFTRRTYRVAMDRLYDRLIEAAMTNSMPQWRERVDRLVRRGRREKGLWQW